MQDSRAWAWFTAWRSCRESMNNLQFQNAVKFQRTEEIEWVLPKNEA